MSSQAIRKSVNDASNVFLLSSVDVKGVNHYTIGSDSLSWDETNSYSITQLAPTFGQLVQGVDGAAATFRCGAGSLPVFDFGLILSCFNAMTMAQLELGTAVPAVSMTTSHSNIETVWFGNCGVLYGLKSNILVPISSSDAQRACRNEKVILSSFIDSRKFILTRVDSYFDINTEDGGGLCTFQIPVSIKRSFPQLFQSTARDASSDMGMSYDVSSPLGELLTNASVASDIQRTLERYKTQSPIDTVVNRTDLICVPNKTYTDPATFIGSLCYTDKQEVALAVNLRGNLFIYRPWFSGDAGDGDNLKVAPSPKLYEFFNVQDECERIMKYANTVTVRPLTPARFDFTVFDAVKTAFFEMRLTRLQFASAFGKVVIPESILLSGLETTGGENVYCIVPVGAIGDNVIVINADGELSAMRNMAWSINDYFYDITEVAGC